MAGKSIFLLLSISNILIFLLGPNTVNATMRQMAAIERVEPDSNQWASWNCMRQYPNMPKELWPSLRTIALQWVANAEVKMYQTQFNQSSSNIQKFRIQFSGSQSTHEILGLWCHDSPNIVVVFDKCGLPGIEEGDILLG